MVENIKARVYDILIASEIKNRVHRLFNYGMLILISLNVLAVIFETENELYQQYRYFFVYFEVISVIIFTIEYILRIWACTKSKEFTSPFFGRIRFALKPLQIIDLIAILPFYIPFLGVDLRFMRAIRLFRLFRLFKIGRYSQSVNTLIKVVRSKKEELTITIFAGFILLILASSMMYIVENRAQPDVFQSIPDAMWWGAVTLTTVGYGDIYPITFLGKLLGALVALLGIGLFALPAGIISSGFVSEIQKRKEEPKICPHCGKVICDDK